MDRKKEPPLNQPACAIAVMAKWPEPGNVKTRLCPPLTPEQAADLYEAFFLDTVSLVSGIEHTDVFVAYDPETARGLLFPHLVSCREMHSAGSGATWGTGS